MDPIDRSVAADLCNRLADAVRKLEDGVTDFSWTQSARARILEVVGDLNDAREELHGCSGTRNLWEADKDYRTEDFVPKDGRTYPIRAVSRNGAAYFEFPPEIRRFFRRTRRRALREQTLKAAGSSRKGYG